MADIKLPSSEPVQTVHRHSRFGIASFALALVGGIMMCGMLVAVNVVVDINAQLSSLDHDTILLFLRISEILGYFRILINLIGVGLGTVAIFEKNAKKLFGILGMILNILVLCGGIGLLLLS